MEGLFIHLISQGFMKFMFTTLIVIKKVNSLIGNLMPDYAPSFTAKGEAITFISYRRGGWKSWVMDASGDNKKLANQYSTYNGWSRISPSGNKMVFQSYRPGHQLYLSNADGSNQQKLIESNVSDIRFCANPSWSPDGKQITYTADNNGVLTIYTMNLEDKSAKLVSKHTKNSTAPSFSPNGQQILYTSLVSGVPQIFVVDSNGKNKHQLSRNTTNSKEYAEQNMNGAVSTWRLAITASWSPDGERIVYSGFTHNKNIELYIIDKDGNNKRQLTYNNSHSTFPSWAPN